MCPRTSASRRSRPPSCSCLTRTGRSCRRSSTSWAMSQQLWRRTRWLPPTWPCAWRLPSSTSTPSRERIPLQGTGPVSCARARSDAHAWCWDAHVHGETRTRMLRSLDRRSLCFLVGLYLCFCWVHTRIQKKGVSPLCCFHSFFSALGAWLPRQSSFNQVLREMCITALPWQVCPLILPPVLSVTLSSYFLPANRQESLQTSKTGWGTRALLPWLLHK